MEFVGTHNRRLRRNLRKNISYDADTFEDVFGYTILRVYDAIVKRGIEIDDYEQYFYMSSRLNYIKTEERTRKRRSRLMFLPSLPEVPEDTRQEHSCVVEDLRNELEGLFGEESAGLFFRFMEAKTRGRISYRTFARREGLSVGYVTREISGIRRYLKN